ncbi:MAG TPA: hypothetical protein VFH47_07480 [Candidatus Thermoplasmatota archaeon]|nr:hypothetical protein [Candidatus Thermoplasmatota archaeon]
MLRLLATAALLLAAGCTSPASRAPDGGSHATPGWSTSCDVAPSPPAEPLGKFRTSGPRDLAAGMARVADDPLAERNGTIVHPTDIHWGSYDFATTSGGLVRVIMPGQDDREPAMVKYHGRPVVVTPQQLATRLLSEFDVEADLDTYSLGANHIGMFHNVSGQRVAEPVLSIRRHDDRMVLELHFLYAHAPIDHVVENQLGAIGEAAFACRGRTTHWVHPDGILVRDGRLVLRVADYPEDFACGDDVPKLDVDLHTGAVVAEIGQGGHCFRRH